MKKPEGKSTRTGLWTTLLATVVAGAGALAVTLPVAAADPEPPPPPPDNNAPAPPPPPAPFNPFGPPAPPADPNAPPTDPSASPTPPPPPPVEPGRVNVPTGGFSYVLPAGWAAGDASRISYGQAVLLKAPAAQGQPTPTDTSILLGKLDARLFAGAEADNQKAAIRLASDMGEFYMPFPGTRINQETNTFDAAGLPGASAYYEVKFTDPNKPSGQIWAAAIGAVTPRVGNQPAQNNRWFVVWLGTANNPVDKAAATALAQSIRPYAPPPPPEAPPPGQPGAPGAAGAPGAPGAPAAGAPAPGSQVGVPVPVAPENAPGMMPPA
jgi:Fibronectin-attachment protein (FAP)